MSIAFSYVPFAQRLLPAPVAGGLAMHDYRVWCGSAVRGEDDKFHLFAARWPQRYKFLPGYQSYSEIVSAVSDTAEGPYRFQEVVLGDCGSEFWDGRMTHNPVVLRWAGVYALFYIGTTFEGAKPAADQLRDGPDFWPWYRGIRIGVATSNSVTGPWVRRDQPFLLPQPGGWDAHVVTNPSPCLARDGRLLLYLFRSDRPLFDAPGVSLEDPCVFEIDGHFEMLAKDLNGNLAGELHAGAHLLWRDG
jgi:hypothetical protein